MTRSEIENYIETEFELKKDQYYYYNGTSKSWSSIFIAIDDVIYHYHALPRYMLHTAEEDINLAFNNMGIRIPNNSKNISEKDKEDIDLSKFIN